MKLSMGMTKAAVLPEPKLFFRARRITSGRRHLTSLSNANDIAILHTNRNSLSLDRRWFLVAHLIDDFEDLRRYRRLLPGS
jgi:hypothetical protein